MQPLPEIIDMVPPFFDRLMNLDPESCTFDALQTLQVNLGNFCNLRCAHCHVNASPAGDHFMNHEVMAKIIRVLAGRDGLTLDITGGCPELHPRFRDFIERTAGLSPRRMLRTNLTVMAEPELAWLPQFCCDQDLVIIGSLPCYQKENVDRQRGDGVFDATLAVLKELNRLGYGATRELNLVYNPGGAFLPGGQQELESVYRKELADRYGIRFTTLYSLANAPLGRFRDHLEKKGDLGRYLNLLSSQFNQSAARSIMCRTLVSVDWQGFLYNCDFNQAAGLPLTDPAGRRFSIDDVDVVSRKGTGLRLGDHCYCCTAGEGSSCNGSLI